MQEIQIQPVASQIVKAVLAGQNCQIKIYQTGYGLFLDLNADDVDIMTAVLVHDTCPLVTRQYSGFLGNLMLVDIYGTEDPEYSELGSRYRLVYLTEVENALL
jgi:hypothetical protein